MASTFQQQSRLRKWVYIGLIVVLFCVSLLLRRGVVEPQAYALQLREQARGEVELTSSAVRLTLLGSRGLATCVLWNMAIEKQKRHQWNELELLVNSITKLQPHFVSPWLFQSWNLAFNVAVECDRTRDKYFYVTRGLQLLSEGERRHQGTLNEASGGEDSRPRFPGNPDMRFYMAMYYQLKIGNSDEKNAMRCLFDMSCINPVERDPKRFEEVDASGKRVVDLQEFATFCNRYPRLVRRLHDRLRCNYPRDVVDYLTRNEDIPSRFEEPAKDIAGKPEPTKLLPPRLQFPILPPRYKPYAPDLPDRTAADFNEDVDVFIAARAWYQYSQDPLPPPSDNPAHDPEVDPKYHRKPKMMMQIFRGYPARAQEYYADTLEDEGWFDASGWLVPNTFELVSRDDEEIRVGTESKYHGQPAWQLAYVMYRDYGKENGLLFTEEERRDLQELAQLYQQQYHIAPGTSPRELTPAERTQQGGAMGLSHDAYLKLFWNQNYRTTTNYDEHYYQCAVERLPETVAARALMFHAASQAARFDVKATERFEQAFAPWLDVLLDNPEYRSIGDIQMDTYERELKYLRLRQDQLADVLKDATTWAARLSQLQPLGGTADLAVLHPPLSEDEKRRIIPIRNVRGPFDMTYAYVGPHKQELESCLLAVSQAALPVPLALTSYQRDRMLTLFTNQERDQISHYWQPLISTESMNSVRDRLGLNREQTTPRQATE